MPKTNLRETIKETIRHHLKKNNGLVMGQCLTAVGWVGGTLPELYEKDGMIDTGTIKDKDGNVIGTEEEKPKDLHVTGFTFEKTGETEEYQGMDLAKLVPLLTAALQEAVTEIESLKTRVAALEGS